MQFIMQTIFFKVNTTKLQSIFSSTYFKERSAEATIIKQNLAFFLTDTFPNDTVSRINKIKITLMPSIIIYMILIANNYLGLLSTQVIATNLILRICDKPVQASIKIYYLGINLPICLLMFFEVVIISKRFLFCIVSYAGLVQNISKT